MTYIATEQSKAFRHGRALDKIQLLGPDDEEAGARWDAFVRGEPEGTFYHLSGWQRIIGGFLGHNVYYIFVERDGQINAVLPLARVNSWLFGDALTSLPFLVYGGPIARTPEDKKALIGYAVDLAENLGVDYLELRSRTHEHDWPTSNRYVTFRKPLESNVEANLMAVPRKQRAMIRKGIKAGLDVALDDDAGRLHTALTECKRNLGTPFFARAYLQAIKDEFPDECEITTVTHGGQLVCSVMSFVFGREILPYYGGGGVIARKLAGNDFMYWKVMERACSLGIEIFDFGRSQEGSGAYSFKEHWGFEPQPLFHEFHLVRAKSLPDLNPSSSKYQFAIRSWRRFPIWMARLAGPALARRLG